MTTTLLETDYLQTFLKDDKQIEALLEATTANR